MSAERLLRAKDLIILFLWLRIRGYCIASFVSAVKWPCFEWCSRLMKMNHCSPCPPLPLDQWWIRQGWSKAKDSTDSILSPWMSTDVPLFRSLGCLKTHCSSAGLVNYPNCDVTCECVANLWIIWAHFFLTGQLRQDLLGCVISLLMGGLALQLFGDESSKSQFYNTACQLYMKYFFGGRWAGGESVFQLVTLWKTTLETNDCTLNFMTKSYQS